MNDREENKKGDSEFEKGISSDTSIMNTYTGGFVSKQHLTSTNLKEGGEPSGNVEDDIQARSEGISTIYDNDRQ